MNAIGTIMNIGQHFQDKPSLRIQSERWQNFSESTAAVYFASLDSKFFFWCGVMAMGQIRRSGETQEWSGNAL